MSDIIPDDSEISIIIAEFLINKNFTTLASCISRNLNVFINISTAICNICGQICRYDHSGLKRGGECVINTEDEKTYKLVSEFMRHFSMNLMRELPKRIYCEITIKKKNTEIVAMIKVKSSNRCTLEEINIGLSGDSMMKIVKINPSPYYNELSTLAELIVMRKCIPSVIPYE